MEHCAFEQTKLTCEAWRSKAQELESAEEQSAQAAQEQKQKAGAAEAELVAKEVDRDRHKMRAHGRRDAWLRQADSRRGHPRRAMEA